MAGSVLQCTRRTELFSTIEEIEERLGEKVPPHFHSLLSRADEPGPHWGVTTETPLGDPLRYVPVEALRHLATHPDAADDPINRATWAYVAALPDVMMIALYWD